MAFSKALCFKYKEQRTNAFIGLNILFIHLIFQNYFFIINLHFEVIKELSQ